MIAHQKETGPTNLAVRGAGSALAGALYEWWTGVTHTVAGKPHECSLSAFSRCRVIRKVIRSSALLQGVPLHHSARARRRAWVGSQFEV